MGNCQSGASCAAGMSAPKELNPMDANPAELLNLGPDAEAFFAKGGRSYYDDAPTTAGDRCAPGEDEEMTMKILSSGDVELEGLVNRGRRWMSLGGGGLLGDGDKTGTCVVMCHPHPYLGGNMRNPLMTHLARRLAAAGVTAVRFNFRGVGFSGGKRTWARVAERDDACAAVRHAMIALPWIDPNRVFLFGYSFGSAVALAALDELGDACAGFAGVGHPWGVRAMLVPGQPPCCSVKPKLFFHAVDDVVVGAKFVGTRGGSTERNPELARLREPRSAVALKRDHSFSGGYVNVCEVLVDWLDNSRSVSSGHPSSSSDEGGSRQVRGSDSPESFSSEGSGGVGGGGSRGRTHNHRRSARGDGQRLGTWDSQDLSGFRTDSTSSLSQHAHGERKSLRDGLPTIASRGGQSLRSSLSTGSGGSGLSADTGSDVSLDSQGRPRHRVGPRARHVPGDATPDYRVHGGKFAMPGDRTPDYRHSLNDSTLEPRHRHVLPVGDHAVQEYMRARLRHHQSFELTDTEGSSAVDDEFGGVSKDDSSRVGVWSVDGAPPLVRPDQPPPGSRRAIPAPDVLPDIDVHGGGGSSSDGYPGGGGGEGPRPGEQNSLFSKILETASSREGSQNGQNPLLKGVLEKEGIMAEYRRSNELVVQIPRADMSSGSETDAPVGQPSKFADNQRSILKRESSVGKKMDRLNTPPPPPDPEDAENRTALLKIFGGKARNPFRRAATAVLAANRFVAAGQKRVIWADTTAEGQPIVDTNSRKPTRRNFRSAARATMAMNRFKSATEPNHERLHYGWYGKAPMDPEARRAMNYRYEGSRSNSPSGSVVDDAPGAVRSSPVRSMSRSSSRSGEHSRSPSRERSRSNANAGRTPRAGHRQTHSGSRF
mmetsp:Transcript_5368/g.21952  ORF Transcript_5368/g.21952 Transcript_5368/m.21952 type:complete len:881 (-) Transcript_5368:97-2739(-)